jgi:hypothetical protein
MVAPRSSSGRIERAFASARMRSSPARRSRALRSPTLHERRSHLHQIALSAEQPCNAAAARRWHLHDGLVRVNRHERLVGDHMIALGDVPRDDLGLLEALP